MKILSKAAWVGNVWRGVWFIAGSAILWFATPASADTVYLKNGSTIDCIVIGTNDGMVLLRIGNVGRMEIAEKEIENIEKNDRTGFVDPQRGGVDKSESVGTPLDGGAPGTHGEGEAAEGEPGEEPEEQPPEAGTTEGQPADATASSSSGAAATGDAEKEISALCYELTRQKSNIRASAERKLDEIGAPAVPHLLKLAHHPFERTRIAVFRLLKNHGDHKVVPACLDGLVDDNRFVRELAWQTLKRISGKSYYFPWDDETGTDEERESSLKRWQTWWIEEQARLEAEAKKAAAPADKP